MSNDPDQEEALFADATGCQSAAERVALLDTACNGNPTLRGRIEALLSVHDQAGTFLERPATSPGKPVGPGADAVARLGGMGSADPREEVKP